MKILGLFFVTGSLLMGAYLAFADNKGEGSIDTLQKALSDKEKQLSQRESEMLKKERNLKDKEKVLTDQIERYEKIIVSLRSQVKEIEREKDKKMENLRQVYDRMEPKKASKILESLDNRSASQILMGVRSEKAAEILAKMDPGKARVLTETLLKEANKDIDATTQKGGTP